jgi:glycosidase
VALSVAAAVRRDIPPRRFFAPGLRDGRAIEAAPLHGTGLIALHEPTVGETLLCWFAGDTEAAQPYIEGNNTAVTLTHEIELADWLRAGVALSGGTQYLNLTHDQWPAALRTYRASLAYAPRESLAPAAWVYDAALYEIHPSQFGGFRGLAGELGRLHLLGVNTLCLLPIWARERHWNQPWDETWPGSGNPAILDFETLDPALGTTDDLRHLVTTAHRYGIRVLVDLPLIGCDAASHYLNEHPYWFCQDENGQVIHMSDDPSLCPFDWANEELQNHVLLHAVGLAQSYDLDGFRACVARRTPPNWARRLAHHASAGSLAVLRFLDRLRRELRSRKADAAIVLSSGGPLASASADLVIDEMPHLMYFHTALNRASPHELGEWLSDHLAALEPGAARACFVESHHTWRLNPLADGIRGSRISRALLAGMVLCGFVPLLRGEPEQDVHNDAFVGQLLRIRAAHPTLRTGSSCHSCIACDSPDVFAILRSSPTERIIGLVNFGPHRRTLTLNIRTAPLGAPNEHYGLIDLFGGELLDGGQIVITPDNQGVLRVTAEPFSPYCFLVQPALAPQSPRERHGNGHTVAADTPAGDEQQPDIVVAQI